MDYTFQKNPFSYSFFAYKSNLYSQVSKLLSLLKEKHMVVSLSGGVDSMTLLNVCLWMREQKKLGSVSAVHINYGNKIRSHFEQAFVSQYCKYHQVPLLIREIKEIKRYECERSFYETETQKIRYRMYARVLYLLDLPRSTPILLGHNQDDQLENIFTNIEKRKHYNNLGGMDLISLSNNNLKIVRPLLSFSKDEIVLSAQKTKTIHTRNSTPPSCDRGRLRKELIPFLQKFNPQIIVGLIDLANHIKNLNPIIDKVFLEWKTKAEYTDEKVILQIPFDLSIPFSGYKDLLISVCHNKEIKVPSYKSINSCFNVLRKKENISLNLSSDLKIARQNGFLQIIKS